MFVSRIHHLLLLLHFHRFSFPLNMHDAIEFVPLSLGDVF